MKLLVRLGAALGVVSWLVGAASSASEAGFRPPTRLELAAREFGASEDRYVVEEMNMVRMRDGVRLSTSVIRPKQAGRHPTVLIRTPYDMPAELRKSLYRPLFANDYVVVMQNERGTHWSEGSFTFLPNAREDGYDTLTWIAEQPWSNRRVGTVGCSSAAENQLALGTMRHPAHKAMIAQASGAGVGSIPGVTSQGLFYRNGVPFYRPWILWYAAYGHSYRPMLPEGLTADELRRFGASYDPEAARIVGSAFEAALEKSIRAFPSRDAMVRVGLPRSDFEKFLERTPADADWRDMNFITAKDTNATPTLHVSAWGDVAPYETVKLFEFQQRHPDQYLIMAPTAHCDMLKATKNTMVGDRAMGDARLPYEELYREFFDRHLKEKPAAAPLMPRVQTFVMGAERWVNSDRWPLPGARSQRLYFQSGGKANSRYGDGALAYDASAAGAPADQVVSDPLTPVPSRGGGCCDRHVFVDQSELETRHDVLVYSTPPFKDGLAVIGEIKVVLNVSATTPDADIAVKLVDVFPDGRAFNVHDTIMRLRYRDGMNASKLMQPGQVYQVSIPGLATSNYFGPGHRLRIEIAGSNFPTYERNLHTGGRNYDETQPMTSNITIHHDARHPSYIELPVHDLGATK